MGTDRGCSDEHVRYSNLLYPSFRRRVASYEVDENL
jgi:hypothetical protein